MPNLQVEKMAQLTGHKASIFALSATETPRYFLSGAGDGWVARWDLEAPENGQLVAQVETQIFSLCYLPEREVAVAGNMNGGVHWIDLKQPEKTRNIAHHQKGVFAILRQGDAVFTTGGQGMLTRWNVESGRAAESLQLSHQSLRCIAYCPARDELAVGSSDNAIYLLDAQTLALRHKLEDAHSNSVFSLAYRPDGQYLFSGSRDAHLKAWALGDVPKLADQKPAHWFTINTIAFHPSGRWLATGSRDKTVKIWDAYTFELLKVLETVRDGGHLNSVNRLLWTAHQGHLISGSDDRSLIVWKVKEAQNLN